MSDHCAHVSPGECPDCGGHTLGVDEFVDAVLGVIADSPERMLGAYAVLLTQTAVMAASVPHGVDPMEVELTIEERFMLNEAMAIVSGEIHERLLGLIPDVKEREIRSRLIGSLGAA